MIENHKVKNLIDIQPKLNDEEIKALRKDNINSVVVLQDDLAYITLGGGLTTNGTNIYASMLQIQYMKFFDKLESYLALNYSVQKEQLYLIINNQQAFVYIDLVPLVNKMLPIHILILSNIKFEGRLIK